MRRSLDQHPCPCELPGLGGGGGTKNQDNCGRCQKMSLCVCVHHLHLRASQLQPEGRNARGGTRVRGPEVWGPLGASEFDPSFQQCGVSDTLSQGFLRGQKCSQRPWEALEWPRRGVFVFIPSSKRRWASQRPLRGPIFPDAP